MHCVATITTIITVKSPERCETCPRTHAPSIRGMMGTSDVSVCACHDHHASCIAKCCNVHCIHTSVCEFLASFPKRLPFSCRQQPSINAASTSPAFRRCTSFSRKSTLLRSLRQTCVVKMMMRRRRDRKEYLSPCQLCLSRQWLPLFLLT